MSDKEFSFFEHFNDVIKVVSENPGPIVKYEDMTYREKRYYEIKLEEKREKEKEKSINDFDVHIIKNTLCVDKRPGVFNEVNAKYNFTYFTNEYGLFSEILIFRHTEEITKMDQVYNVYYGETINDDVSNMITDTEKDFIKRKMDIDTIRDLLKVK